MRAQQVVFITDAGGTQNLTIQDYEQTIEGVPYTTNEILSESIDGTIRSNIKGYRYKISLNFSYCAEPDTFRDICNNILTDFDNGFEYILIGIDTESLIRVVLDDGFLHAVKYTNQHGYLSPTITARGQQIVSQIIDLEVEDWGLITEAVTETEDYGLITEAVTETEDYGTIS